jgi:hypothetical protein
MSRYVTEKPKDWISNAVGIEPYPKDPQFYPEWPPQNPTGTYASYRRGLPRGLGCSACALADSGVGIGGAYLAVGGLLCIGVYVAYLLFAGRK